MDSIENISKKTCGLSELIANLNTDDVDVDTGDMDDDEVVRIISRADNREKKMKCKITTETDLRDVDAIRWPDGEIGGIIQAVEGGTRALVNRKNSRDWFTVDQLIKTGAIEE